MTDSKRNPPFGLDLPFNEAMERFAGVIPAELAVSPRSVPQPEGPSVLTWFKKLSKTDAQQETTGGLVPYLRLTKSSLKGEDFQSWFRNQFFNGVAFVPGVFGREHVEIAKIPFEVTVRDVNIGTETLTITHGGDREQSNNTPNTWLHWSSKLEHILQLNDFSARPVRITRDDHGAFHLDIDAAADANV